MCEVASKRGIDCPASASPGLYARGGQQEKERWGQESEAYVIYSRECHIGSPDH